MCYTTSVDSSYEFYFRCVNNIFVPVNANRVSISYFLSNCLLRTQGRGITVSMVSVYRLHDRGSILSRGKDFSSRLCVHTGSGAHPASCIMVTGGPFPGLKPGRGVTLTTHSDLVPRSKISRSYTSSHTKRLRGLYWDSFNSLRTQEQGITVSMVSDYRLHDQGSIPSRGKDFSSRFCVQTGSGVHPASCAMGTGGGPFPGLKPGRGVTLTTHSHLVPRSRMSRSYTSSPPKRPQAFLRHLWKFVPAVPKL
jgi:hypothetical protein